MQRERVYVIMLKTALVLVKNMFFGLKKGISELSRWVAQKHTAFDIFPSIFNYLISIITINFYILTIEDNLNDCNSKVDYLLLISLQMKSINKHFEILLLEQLSSSTRKSITESLIKSSYPQTQG